MRQGETKHKKVKFWKWSTLQVIDLHPQKILAGVAHLQIKKDNRIMMIFRLIYSTQENLHISDNMYKTWSLIWAIKFYHALSMAVRINIFFLFGVIIYQWIFQWTHYLASVIARIKITNYYALARDMPVIHTNHWFV